MISVEEAKRLGIAAKFSEPLPDFMATIKVYGDEALRKSFVINRMNEILQRLFIRTYAQSWVRMLFTFLIFPTHYDGIQRQERKTHRRSAGEFLIDIKIADYEGFCKADEREALAILARETLRGAAKFLSKEKHFDHEKFLRDLEGIFRSEGIL